MKPIVTKVLLKIRLKRCGMKHQRIINMWKVYMTQVCQFMASAPMPDTGSYWRSTLAVIWSTKPSNHCQRWKPAVTSKEWRGMGVGLDLPHSFMVMWRGWERAFWPLRCYVTGWPSLLLGPFCSMALFTSPQGVCDANTRGGGQITWAYLL